MPSTPSPEGVFRTPDAAPTPAEDTPTQSAPNRNPDPGDSTPAVLSVAIEQSPDSIVIGDLTGRIRYANAAATRLIGRPADELLNRHFIVALALDDSPARYLDIARVVGGGDVWTGTQPGRAPDGSPINLDLV